MNIKEIDEYIANNPITDEKMDWFIKLLETTPYIKQIKLKSIAKIIKEKKLTDSIMSIILDSFYTEKYLQYLDYNYFISDELFLLGHYIIQCDKNNTERNRLIINLIIKNTKLTLEKIEQLIYLNIPYINKKIVKYVPNDSKLLQAAIFSRNHVIATELIKKNTKMDNICKELYFLLETEQTIDYMLANTRIKIKDNYFLAGAFGISCHYPHKINKTHNPELYYSYGYTPTKNVVLELLKHKITLPDLARFKIEMDLEICTEYAKNGFYYEDCKYISPELQILHKLCYYDDTRKIVTYLQNTKPDNICWLYATSKKMRWILYNCKISPQQ